MTINNVRDLKLAYSNISLFNACLAAYGCEKPEGINNYIAGIKRDIRAYYKRTATSDRHLVKDEGIDGFIELIELPEVEDPVEYFEEVERMTILPSAYDCTGRAFTRWYKIFNRNGKTMAYHAVGIDC